MHTSPSMLPNSHTKLQIRLLEKKRFLPAFDVKMKVRKHKFWCRLTVQDDAKTHMSEESSQRCHETSVYFKCLLLWASIETRGILLEIQEVYSELPWIVLVSKGLLWFSSKGQFLTGTKRKEKQKTKGRKGNCWLRCFVANAWCTAAVKCTKLVCLESWIWWNQSSCIVLIYLV